MDIAPGDRGVVGATPGHFHALVRTRLDPEVADCRSNADQVALVATFGGQEAALSVGKLGASSKLLRVPSH